MEHKNIITVKEGGILTISINRPDKMNALNKVVIRELAIAIDQVYVDTEIKLAILTGVGSKAFVAGADISEFSSLDSSGGMALSQAGQDLVFSKIENSPKIFIAAVNGFALGGGCELAMACHLRYASDNAKLGLPEINLGLIPGYGGTQRLTQLIGKAKAMEMMLTGGMISASEAAQLGLLNHVCTQEELMPMVMEMANNLKEKAPAAVMRIIKLANAAAFGNPAGLKMEVAAFGELFDTADAKEGATAFLEKRKPVFTGK
jgi:enoyl-CoA hydratase